MAILTIDTIVNPLLLIPALIMTALFYVMRMIYINAGRSFIRVESLGKLKSSIQKTSQQVNSVSYPAVIYFSAYSPIFSHLNGTLQG